MIRYFRINDPYRLVGLLILLIIIYMPLFLDPPGITNPELKSLIIGEKLNEDQSMYTQLVDSTAPLAAWFYELSDSLFGRSLLARHIMAFMIIFFQSAYVGILFISRKVFNENTYIPSFLYSLLFFFSYDSLMLSGELVGFVFLLLALNNLFKEIEFRIQRDETVFNLGLFLGLASLFSFAYSIYLMYVLVVLAFFTRTSARKFLLLIFGFLFPHVLATSIAYVNNSLPKFWTYYYLPNLGFQRETFISMKGLLVLGAVPVFYFVISLVMLQRDARFSKYQSQILQIMFLWIGFSILYTFVCKDLRPQHLIVFIPALALIFTHFFLFIRRKKFIELNTWVLFLGILATGYATRYNKLESVDYKKLLVHNSPATVGLKNRRVLVLENNPAFFLQNKLATPYLDWSLSQEIFRNADYYENLTEVFHFMKADPPQVIIDPENRMKPFFERAPLLKKEYIRKEARYERVNSK